MTQYLRIIALYYYDRRPDYNVRVRYRIFVNILIYSDWSPE